MAHGETIPVEAIVSTAFGCPYEGDVAPERVAQLAGHLLDADADRLSFGDTTGMATPRRVDDLLDALERAGITADRVGLHFHNTRGTALANVITALDRGVTRYDSSIGGLGGCPYAPGASGNAVTEDLVHMLDDMGIDTGIDLDALIECARLAQDIVGRELPSALLHAGPRLHQAESVS
jgi:hydroxymethylglutaryl-CoA lyase